MGCHGRDTPLSPRYHSRAYTEAHNSILGTLQGLANHTPSLQEILLDSTYALPGEVSTDAHGNQYQDFSLIHSELTVAHPELLQVSPDQPWISYHGAAYVRFYPYPGVPLRDYRRPMNYQSPPVAPAPDPYENPLPRFRTPTPPWIGSGTSSPSPPPPPVVENEVADLDIPGGVPPVLLVPDVTTVTTRDSSRPKMHAKPTQADASGRE